MPQTLAAVPITQKTAEGYSAVFRGLNLISGDVAKLPIFVYRAREGDDGREPDKRHPAWKLLRRQVNASLTPYQYFVVSTVDILLRGNHYALISRAGNGAPVELLRLDPQSVAPPAAIGGTYKWHRPDGGTSDIPGDQLLHVRRYTEDGIKGKGLLDVARESLGLGLAARNYGAVFFAQGAAPSFVIKDEMPLTGEPFERARKDLAETYAGWRNSGKPMFLTGKRSIEKLSLTPEEAQLLQLRAFEVREIANFLGLPPHMLGDDTRTSFKSLEQEAEAYLTHSLDPWLVCWESELRSKLLTEDQKAAESHTIEFMREALIRADMAARGEFIQQTVGWGVMTRNEHRRKLNLPPVEGGDKALVPGNMTSDPDGGAGMAGQPDAGGGASGDEPADDEDARSLAADSLRRFVARVCGRASTLAAGGANMPAWLERSLEPEFGELAEAMAGPALRVLRCPLNTMGLFGVLRSGIAERIVSDKTLRENKLKRFADEVHHELMGNGRAVPAAARPHRT